MVQLPCRPMMHERKYLKAVRCGQPYPVRSKMATWALLLLLPGITGTQAAGVDPQHRFLQADALVSLPTHLGTFPYLCVGDLLECDNGFSMGWQFEPPPPDVLLPEFYVISSGGQNPYSKGFYARRNYGREFEVGVAKADQQWRVSFTLREGSLTHLLFTWEETLGLTVYVDGITVGDDVTGSSRVYPNPAYDQFRELVIGAANHTSSSPIASMRIYDVNHWDQRLTPQDIIDLFEQDRYLRGCVSAEPSEVTSPITVTDDLSCRKSCQTLHADLAYMSNDVTCACLDTDDVGGVLGAVSLAHCGQEAWIKVYWVSSVTEPMLTPINLEVETVLPTEHDYIRPDETVTFMFSEDTDEEVVYHVDFGDETQAVSRQHSLSHAWDRTGQYDVVVEAVTRNNSEVKVISVTIEWVEEGVAPELLLMSASLGFAEYEVQFYMAAVSQYAMACIFMVGTDTMNLDLTDYISQAEKSFKYQLPGVYSTDLTCTNEYGSTTSNLDIISSQPDLQFLTQRRGDAVVLPLAPGTDLSEGFVVKVDQEEVAYTTSETEIHVVPEVFTYSGEHVVSLSSQHGAFFTLVVTLQAPITGLTLTPLITSTEPGHPITLLASLTGGDHVHAFIDYEDGQTESRFLYEVMDPLLINHTYANLGHYEIRVEVANDVSHQNAIYSTSIERPLQVASMTADDEKLLGTATTFTLLIDMHISPAMPVNVRFSYGNDVTETVRLGEQQAHPVPLLHTYTYPDYGIYTVTAVVYNDLGELEVSCSHQVGQNISYVDLYTSSERVRVGQDVTITIDAPYGQPIRYDLDMGDGTTIVLHDPPLEDNNVDSGSGDAGDDVDELKRRRRREAGDSVDILSTATIKAGTGEIVSMAVTTPSSYVASMTDGMGLVNNTVSETTQSTTTTTTASPASMVPPNDPIGITYRYSTPGDYVVQAHISNLFTYAETWLCPDILVVAANTLEPSCDRFLVSFPETGSITILRSQDLTVKTAMQVDCSGAESDYEYDYSWRTERHTPSGDLRPELEVCQDETLRSTLTIPGNTLWYGTYDLHVTTGVRILPSSRTRRALANDTEPLPPSPSTTTTAATTTTEEPMLSQPTMVTATEKISLTVQPSDLVATISGESLRQTTIFQVVTMSLAESYDPDVDNGNKTLMTADLVCYVEQNHPDFASLSHSDLLNHATKIANNSRQSVVLWDVDCFVSLDHVWVLDWAASFPGNRLVTNNGQLVFKLFVNKDTREATASQRLNVWTTNSTNLLDNLASLLEGNDTGATLMAVDLIAGSLNAPTDDNDTEAAAQRTTVRTVLIDAMGQVTSRVENLDQLTTSSSVLRSVTSVPSEVTDDSKATAASAMKNTASLAGGMMTEVDMGVAENMAGEMVGMASNIMPFGETPPEEVPEPTSIYITPASMLVATTPFPDVQSNWQGRSTVNISTSVYAVNGTYYPSSTVPPITTALPPPTTIPVTVTTRSTTTAGVTTTTVRVTTMEEDLLDELEIEEGCCTPLGGLCEWTEPNCTYLDEDIRKKTVWDNQTCAEIHPDDLSEVLFRFELYKAVQKKHLYDQRRTTTIGAMGAVAGLGGVLLEKADEGSNITVASSRLTMEVARVDGGNGSIQGMEYPASALAGLDGVGATTMESDNPFTYSDSASLVNSKVKTMSFSSNGSTVPMSNMTEEFAIWQVAPQHVQSTPVQVHVFTYENGVPNMNFHKTRITTNNTGLHFIIRPSVPTDRFEVFIMYEGWPNSTYYDYKNTIPTAVDESWWTDVPQEDEVRPFMFFPPQYVTRLNGTYTIGIRLIETTVRFGADGEGPKNVTYTTQMFSSSCLYWNEGRENWQSDGCRVDGATTQYRFKCMCNHLTSFGSDFVVPANTIDFSTVFSLENFIEAIPVFVTVGLVLLLYVGSLIWARHMDKKDVAKWGASPLEDNLPTDNYHYQMTVYTGTKKLAGTKSKISFIVSGDEADTGVRRLYDGKRKELPSSSIYNYIVSVEQSLGPLTYLRIWHDNTGPGKMRSWFLNQVQLIDLQTGEKFFFLCDRWLAVEEDDGMVERVIPIAGSRELSAFKHLFSGSVRKKLTNDHLWVSVVSRPTRSNFTRVQRISTCVALLFLTMIANCMFFRGTERVQNTSSITVGPFSFTLQQLYVSVISTLIVFPPSLIIVSLFRKARPKKNAVGHKNVRSKKTKWRHINPGSSLWQNQRQKSRYQRMKEKFGGLMCSHKKSKYDDGPSEDILKKKKKKPLTFPWWTIYIAWTLCTLSILVPAFFTVLYSMEWGREKSLDWLTTFLLSFFQSVAVVQPVKVLLLAAFISCIMRKPDLGEEDEDYADDYNAMPAVDETLFPTAQRRYEEIAAERKKAAAYIAPPDTESLEAARKLRMQEIQMEAILKECIVYFFFVIVTFFLSYETRDGNSYIFAQNIKDTFKYTSPAFDSITRYDQVYTYLKSVLVPNQYSDTWYDGADQTNWQESLQIDDRVTIRAGVARLRQLRIKDDTCDIQPLMEHVIDHCRADYNFFDDDTKDYLPRWIPDDGLNKHYTYLDCYAEVLEENATDPFAGQDPWKYSNSLELKNGPYWGLLTMYKGGGYTINFKRNAAMTIKLIEELENYGWLDERSRALFIEFTLYNANVNLFGSVILLVEWMAAGSALTRTEVKVFRLYSYVGGWGVIVITFEVTFLCFILYFIYVAVKLIAKERVRYFKNFWNLMDALMLSLAIICIAMYGLKKVFGGVAVNQLEASESADYVNFVTISFWDEIFGFMLATVVFTATIKFVKMLRFNKRMGMLGDTIRLATKDLKTFTTIFFIYFSAFAMMAYMLFGTDLADYGSFVGTVEALFAFALGSFDFDALKGVSRFMGPLFFFLFVCIVYIGLMGMFMTIIYDSFAAVKADTALRSNDYEIVDFMWRKFRGVFGWGGEEDKKKKDGEEEDEPAEVEG